MRTLTPSTVARAIGVSESTLKRWCDSGLIAATKTAGGHRRLSVDSVLEFVRTSQRELDRPDLLGLPAIKSGGPRSLNVAKRDLTECLVKGDEECCRRIIWELHLASVMVSQICDDVIAPAFGEIGKRWESGDVDVYQERRACEICNSALRVLRDSLPSMPANSPLSIGCAPLGDPYQLPTSMVEIVLRQSGFRSQSLGIGIPLENLATAVHDKRPRIVWISVSHLTDESEFAEQYQKFFDRLSSEVAVVVGGRALTERLRRSMKYSAFCDNVQHLETFARTLLAS